MPTWLSAEQNNVLKTKTITSKQTSQWLYRTKDKTLQTTQDWSLVLRFLSFSVCGRTLQDSIGQFSFSPTPDKEELCQWRISATHGEKIVLNITALDIPVTGHAGGEQCDTDYLEVRDGHYVLSNLIGKNH